LLGSSLQAMAYLLAQRLFPSKQAVTQHFRSVRDDCPLGESIHDSVVHWLLRRHPQWEEKSQGMTAIGTGMVKGSPAIPPRKEIVILRGAAQPMDISWTKLVKRLQPDGTLKHPSDLQECLDELRIAARQEIEDQLSPLRRAGKHLDHASPATFEQLLYDWVIASSLPLQRLEVASNDGLVVQRSLKDRDLAQSWQEYHRANAVLVLRTPAEHAAQPQVRIDWSALLDG
jgi:hypothetical protein